MKNIIDFIIKVGVEGLEAGKEMVIFFMAGHMAAVTSNPRGEAWHVVGAGY